jgi:hypothetical protein
MRRWEKNVTHIGKMTNTYKILIGKPKGNRLLIKARCGWEE